MDVPKAGAARIRRADVPKAGAARIRRADVPKAGAARIRRVDVPKNEAVRLSKRKMKVRSCAGALLKRNQTKKGTENGST